MGLASCRRQPRVAAALLSVLSRGRLGQVYLFSGPEGAGKGRLALELAKAILCEGRTPGSVDSCGSCRSCLDVAAGRHPDVKVFRPEAGKLNYPVRQVREEIREHAYLKPARGPKRVLIVGRAEALVKGTGQNEGADTLLKLLEEPPRDTVLILLAAHPERLPETVRSRCQQVRFDQPPAGAVASELAAGQGLPEDEALFAAHLAGLDLETALGFLQGRKKDRPDLAAIRRVLLDVVNSLERRSYPEILALAAALDEAARGWPALTGALGVLAALYRDAAVMACAARGGAEPGQLLTFGSGPEAEAAGTAAGFHPPDVLVRAAERTLSAQEDSRRYPARLLLIEVLLLDLKELLGVSL